MVNTNAYFIESNIHQFMHELSQQNLIINRFSIGNINKLQTIIYNKHKQNVLLHNLWYIGTCNIIISHILIFQYIFYVST